MKHLEETKIYIIPLYGGFEITHTVELRTKSESVDGLRLVIINIISYNFRRKCRLRVLVWTLIGIFYFSLV